MEATANLCFASMEVWRHSIVEYRHLHPAELTEAVKREGYPLVVVHALLIQK